MRIEPALYIAIEKSPTLKAQAEGTSAEAAPWNAVD
jgi:hypothetical protein